MHLPLSLLSAVAFVVIASYIIIQCIINAQLGSARSPEDPYTVILHKDNIAIGHVCHGFHAFTWYFTVQWCKQGLPQSFCWNSSIYTAVHAWNSGLNWGSDSSSLSVELCLARKSTWPSVLKILRYIPISLHVHVAQKPWKLWVGDPWKYNRKNPIYMPTMKISCCKNIHVYSMGSGILLI